MPKRSSISPRVPSARQQSGGVERYRAHRAADTIVYAWLPLLIRRMNERYPGIVSLDLTIDTSLKLSQRIKMAEVDVGFIMGPVLAADIFSKPLCTFESCWVGAVDLPLPETGVTLEDIAHFPLLTSRQDRSRIIKLAGTSRLPWPVGQPHLQFELAVHHDPPRGGGRRGRRFARVLVDDIIASGEARNSRYQPLRPPLTFSHRLSGAGRQRDCPANCRHGNGNRQ